MQTCSCIKVIPTHFYSIVSAWMTGALLYFFIALSVTAQQPSALSNEALVAELQRGGLILYVRHAATDHSQSDIDLSDLRNCQLQRNLSQQGKDETQILKRAIATLNIPIGKVYTSPYCRCVDTAKLAFEDYEIKDDLRATFYTDKGETNELVEKLKGYLSTKPAGATNTVIVGHTANLRDLTKVWPHPEGVTHIFRPLGNGRYEHMGRIEPLTWPTLFE